MFFAVSAGTGERYRKQDIVKFHHTITSISPNGSGWNSDTSKFQCPYDGYYQFLATLWKYDGGEDSYDFGAGLIVSGTRVARTFNRRSGSGVVSFSSTMSAIAACEVGQEVWVEIYPYPTNTWLSDSPNQHYQQFSGHMIKQGLN